MSARCNPAPELRARLRAATQEQHQMLDTALGRLDLADRYEYARFLRVQVDSRAGVEKWLLRNCPEGWVPPSQSSQLKRDLDWLGSERESDNAPEFAAPAFTPDAWLGAAWVLAGSSLGNKMMERDLSQRAPEAWPMAFLRDDAMPAYFKALRPLLAGKDADPGAERAANAVFGHFLAEADRQLASAFA